MAGDEVGVVLAGGPAGGREDLRGEQREDDAVLVSGPHRPVVAEEGGAGRLLATEADRPVEQSGDEPLEADRHLPQVHAEVGRDAVDHGARHERLADAPARPSRTRAAVQVLDRDGEVVVGVHQPRVGRDDAVPVGVCVVAGRDVVPIALCDKARHGRRRAAVHPDPAVLVEGHEPPRRVDERVDHCQVEAVALADLAPVVHGRPAHRVGADLHSDVPDPLQVNDARQVGDIGGEVVVVGRGGPGPGEGSPPHLPQAVAQVGVGRVCDDAGDVGVGGPAVGRVVLEPTVARGVVRGGDDDAVGQPRPLRREVLAPVGREDRVRDRGGRGVAVAGVDEDGDTAGDEDLEGGGPRRLGEGVRVAAEEERAVDAGRAAVVDDCLGRREDVRLVEGPGERGAPVPARAEGDLLVDVVGVGLDRVVGGDDVADVDEVLGQCGLARSVGCAHGPTLPPYRSTAASRAVSGARAGWRPSPSSSSARCSTSVSATTSL